jgi:hypothetical protein
MRVKPVASLPILRDASDGERASGVRLPPLWLFGALAALMLIMAATKDTGDVLEYHCYALDFWQGAHAANAALAMPHVPKPCSVKIPDLATAPFQELPREYGPLSLVAFSLPLLAPLGWYNMVFYALMCGVILGVAWLLDHYGPRGAGHIWLLYTLLGVMLEAAGRFDALPAAAALIALLAAQRGRSLLAYGALAVGALLKFFPLALLPLLLIQSWRQRREEPLWRGPALFAGLMLAGEGIAALINPARALQPLGFMGARCVEIEAFPATLAFLWASLTGGKVTPKLYPEYSSVCQLAPGTDGAQTITLLAAVIGIAAVYWFFWRERLSLTHSFIFTTGLLILGVKVFSVQYLLWLSPLIAYAYGTQLMALASWGAVCLATSLYYPVAINPWVVVNLGLWLSDHTPLLIAVRNILMVVVGALALRGALDRSRDGAAPGAVGKREGERSQ